MVGTHIQFEASEPIADLLVREIRHISFAMDNHGKCSMVSLWKDLADGISISSQMHDVALRLEVGVLRLKRVQSQEIGESVMDFASPQIPSELWKLQITENGISLESGLRFVFETAEELVIVPADFPYSLSIQGNCVPTINLVSEYSIDRYVQERIF